MNLKESFRYQNFLDGLLEAAINSITTREHCLTTTKKHLRSKANPDAEDTTEIVEVEPFHGNDDVLRFLQWLVKEKGILTTAINKAKAATVEDMDAAIESNKYRQRINTAIRGILKYTTRKITERGMDYKFNVEGNQAGYYYDIEIETTEAYDKAKAKTIMRDMSLESDNISAEIDSILINTDVKYEPKFNVNESFEDVMEEFLSNN